MRYISANVARLLAVLGLLIFFSVPVQADPVVTFSPGGGTPTIFVTFFDAPFINAQFVMGTTDANGNLTVTLFNITRATFQGYHFVSDVVQPAPWTGNGLPFFDTFVSVNTTDVFTGLPNLSGIDFFRGPTGIGIAPVVTFTVTFTGFTPNTVIRGSATIPEPTTLLLLGTGLAGVAIKARKRFGRRK